MPRRHPRAVYEVYDADEALGGPSESADRPNRQETPEIAEQPAEQATPYEDSESSRTLSELPMRGALTRMLAGATLCVAAVCVVAAIAIVLLHVVNGAGSARRRSAPAPQVARALHGGASTTAAASVPMAHEVPHPRVAAVANAIRGAHPSPSPPAATAHALAVISVATTLSIARSAPSIQALAPALQITSDAIPGCECTPAEAEFGFER
jgi:hypothetical protein